MPTLTLVRASKSRGGDWDPDDYDVRDESRRVVGRIMRHPQAPQGQPWFWTITARLPQYPQDRGYAASREQAMAEFKVAWEREPDPIDVWHPDLALGCYSD